MPICPFCASGNIVYTDISMRPVDKQIFVVHLDPACPVNVLACMCMSCAKVFFVREGDVVTDAYVAWGYKDGWCGHKHTSRIEAEACRAKYSATQRGQGKYSDRSVIIICNCKEFEEVPVIWQGEDNYPRCGYCQKRVMR